MKESNIEQNISNNIQENHFNNNENINHSNNNISFSYNAAINNPITVQLIQFGFNPIYSYRVFSYFHPQNFEEALDYLLTNNGIVQHHFVQDRGNLENYLCYICGEEREIHLGYIPGNININNRINNIEENISNINNKIESKEDKKEIFQRKICDICSNFYFPNSENKLENCGHSFCNYCWYDYLSIKIKENKISYIKCLDYECQEKLTDEFIIKLLNSNQELISKFKKFQNELEIINNPNKKFCPHPNCNSFLELKNKNKKYVKCLNGHNFCFNCLNEPHGDLPCKDNLDKSLIAFSKSHFLKKCPNCSIITEKITGCNHITCSKCNYQWCWLCNGKYDPEHYREGKCKGYQFFRPKDEKDIQLAFEGKIILDLSQRQVDTFDEISININHPDNFDNHHVENERPSIHYTFKYGIITRCFLLFVYILFGHDFVILNVMNKYNDFHFIFHLLLYFPYKIIFLIGEIYFNIINLIILLFKEGFMDFTSLIYDQIIFANIYPNLRIFFFKILIFLFSLFIYSLFVPIYFWNKKISIRKTYVFIVYLFISIILLIVFFPYQILLNIIIIFLFFFENGNSFIHIINNRIRDATGFYYDLKN